jgi:hypothetical protein
MPKRFQGKKVKAHSNGYHSDATFTCRCGWKFTAKSKGCTRIAVRLHFKKCPLQSNLDNTEVQFTKYENYKGSKNTKQVVDKFKTVETDIKNVLDNSINDWLSLKNRSDRGY